MKKAIIHIGGSYNQISGIREIKRLGFYLIITDKNPDSPGRMLADRFEIIDGSDIKSLMYLAKNISKHYELTGIYATSDFGLQSVSEINKGFNLKGHFPDIVNITSNKRKFSELCRNNDIQVPDVIDINSSNEIQDYNDNFPVIIKPVDSCGSQGIKTVYNKKEFENAYINAMKFSNTVIVEKIVLGKHLDVNGYLWEGKFYPCGIMERFFSDPPYHYPIWGYSPTFLKKEQEKTVYHQIERISSILNINYGPVKGDVIWTDDGPVLLELGTRFHGDVSTQKIIPLSYGFNPVHDWFYALMNNKPIKRDLKYINYAGWQAVYSDKKRIYYWIFWNR